MLINDVEMLSGDSVWMMFCVCQDVAVGVHHGPSLRSPAVPLPALVPGSTVHFHFLPGFWRMEVHPCVFKDHIPRFAVSLYVIILAFPFLYILQSIYFWYTVYVLFNFSKSSKFWNTPIESMKSNESKLSRFSFPHFV